MNDYHDPHAEIMEVGFLPLSEVQVKTMIGSPEMDVTVTHGLPVFARPQSASFSERQAQSGDLVEQELDVVFTDDDAEYIQSWRGKVDVDCLVVIRYTNGKKLVVGTDMAPVRCEVEHSGSPRTTHITFKRKSPEFAKVLKSLS